MKFTHSGWTVDTQELTAWSKDCPGGPYDILWKDGKWNHKGRGPGSNWAVTTNSSLLRALNGCRERNIPPVSPKHVSKPGRFKRIKR